MNGIWLKLLMCWKSWEKRKKERKRGSRENRERKKKEVKGFLGKGGRYYEYMSILFGRPSFLTPSPIRRVGWIERKRNNQKISVKEIAPYPPTSKILICEKTDGLNEVR